MMVQLCSVCAEFPRTEADNKNGVQTTENSVFYPHSQLHNATYAPVWSKMTRSIATNTQHVLKYLQKFQSFSPTVNHWIGLCWCPLSRALVLLCFKAHEDQELDDQSVIQWQWNCVLRSSLQVTPQLSVILSASNTQNYSHDSPEWRQVSKYMPSDGHWLETLGHYLGIPTVYQLSLRSQCNSSN